MRFRFFIFCCVLTLNLLRPSVLRAEAVSMRFFTISDGLYNNQARRIVEMPDGRILAQVEGMFCLYDGERFHQLPYDRRKIVKMESFFNTDYYFDRAGRLWVRDLHHLYAFDSRTCRLLDAPALLAGSGIARNGLRTFFIDADGCAWIHTVGDELYYYDWQSAARRVMSITDRNEEDIPYAVCDVIQVGRLHYIFLSTGEMICWDMKAGRSVYKLRLEEAKRGFLLKAAPLNTHAFVVRTARGLHRFDVHSRRLVSFFTDGHVSDFRTDRLGRLWAVASGRILRFNTSLQIADSYDVITDVHQGGQRLVDIESMAIDRTGGIWIGTNNDGVAYHNPQPPLVRHFPLTDAAGSHGIAVRKLYRAAGHIFAATSSGLYTIDNSNQAVPSDGAFRYTSCNNIVPDRLGRLWITSNQAEIHCLDPQSGRVESFLSGNVHDLWGNVPFCQEVDSGLYLISVRLNRLSLFTPSERHIELLTTRFPELLQFRNVVDACAMPGGYLVGTQNGFYFFDNRTRTVDFRRLQVLNDNIYSDKCNCLMTAADGTIWIGSQNGLFHFHPSKNSLRRYSSADGLPNSCILSLATDADGNLWVATANGIARLTFRKTEAVPDIFVIGEADGLGRSLLMERSACTTADGRVLFGCSDGFYEVDMRRLHLPEQPFTPRLTAVRVNDSTVLANESGKWTFRHNENSLAFDVSTLNYVYPQHTRYRYRLEGAGQDWTSVSGQAGMVTISYRLLRPGRYTLQVEATLQGQPWSGHMLQVTFRIRPPWWRSWWAVSLYLLLAALVVWQLIRAYVRHQNQKLDLLRREKVQTEREQLNEERLRFFTNVTHELRTPLTLILGPLDDLKHNPSLLPQVRKKVESISGSAARLLQMVNQLLEFRKSETGNRTLHPQRLSLAGHVSDIFRRFATLTRNPKLRFEEDIQQAGMTDLSFDPEVVSIILNNLLSNAVKYTPQGTIRLSLADDGDDIVLAVSDTGFGISAAALPHIFERYYQANDRHQASGTGIGLSLAHSLAGLHHARLSVESKEGAGSTFSLRFHRSDLLPQDEPAVTAVVPATGTETSGVAQTASAETRRTDDGKTSGYSVEILIVEDERGIRDYIAETLSPYQCLKAANGREGAEMALANIPDIIISDVMMPEMDGTEMCRILKQDIRTSHIPVVMLTAKDSLHDKEEGYESGADAYLTKPFTGRMLQALVTNILTRRQRMARQLLQPPSAAAAQEPQSTPATPAEPVPQLSALDRRFVTHFNQIVDEHLGDPELDILFLCDHMAMSRTTLYRKVKGLMGIPANEYIRKRRLQRAYEMLRSQEHSDTTIAGIAYDCGFSSPSYFRSCFKEEFGILPGEVVKM